MAEQRSSGSHGWRGPTTAAQAGTGRRPGLSWRGRLVILLVFALALAGALVGLVLRLRSYDTPFLLAIPITEYRVPEWPINTFARQDSEALLTYFAKRRQPLDNQQRDRLVQELQELRDHHEKKVVVYLSMLAVVRGDAVYLLPIDANPAQPEHGIPLTEVLSDLNACPAPNRLLILDIMRPVAGVEVEILTNDVAAQVKTTVAKTNYDNLWVLCPCSPSECALPADELQQSAFGHYLCQGLAGYADVDDPTGNHDHNVTVRELAAYIASHVERWAKENRGTRQTPVLLGHGPDFSLAHVPEQLTPVEPAAAETEPTYPKWLADAWQHRDAWETERLFRVAPEAFAGLEVDLLRAERRWRSGADADRVQRAVAQARAARDQQMQAARSEIDPASGPIPFALALTPDAAAGPDPEVAKALADLLAGLPPPSAKPADPKKAADAGKAGDGAKAVDKFVEKFKSKPPLRLAWTVFVQAAADPAPTFELVQLADAVLRKLKLPQPHYAETVLLQRLVEHGSMNWSPAVVHDLLASLKEEGHILAADPRALAGAYEDFEAAAKVRRAAEHAFFTTDDSAPASDSTPPRALPAYRKVSASVNRLDHAYRLRDRARAILPGYTPYLLAPRPADDTPEARWNEALQAVLDIDTLLSAPTSSGANLERIEKLRRPVTDLAASLDDDLPLPFEEPAIRSLVKREASDRLPDYLELEARLASPRLRAPVRAQAWQAIRQLGGQLWQRTHDEETGQRVAGPAGAGSISAATWDASRTRRRGRVAVGLLKLAGTSGMADVDQALAQAEAAPSNTAWQSFEQQLRSALDRARAEQTQRIQDRRTACRKSRQDLWRRLGKHYQTERDAFPADSKYRSYFNDAAEEYLREP